MSGMKDLAEGTFARFPSSFVSREIETNGAKLYTRVGGKGPAVLLLHGYGLTGDSWAPLAAVLAETRTVVIPDLRGFGLSSKPEGGYDKKTQAGGVGGIFAAVGIAETAIVSMDMGSLLAFAFAAQNRGRVTRWIQMEAPIPGIGPWEKITSNPKTWHFGFGGLDAERLVDGRERIYLDHFWNDFSADPADITEDMRQHYATLYAQPGAMRAGFKQFNAFPQDANDNRTFVAEGKLTFPVLAVGGERSNGAMTEELMKLVAEDVQGAVISGAGHWLMEENPKDTVKVVQQFLNR